jgi:hypothetical protein
MCLLRLALRLCIELLDNKKLLMVVKMLLLALMLYIF